MSSYLGLQCADGAKEDSDKDIRLLQGRANSQAVTGNTRLFKKLENPAVGAKVDKALTELFGKCLGGRGAFGLAVVKVGGGRRADQLVGQMATSPIIGKGTSQAEAVCGVVKEAI